MSGHTDVPIGTAAGAAVVTRTGSGGASRSASSASVDVRGGKGGRSGSGVSDDGVFDVSTASVSAGAGTGRNPARDRYGSAGSDSTGGRRKASEDTAGDEDYYSSDFDAESDGEYCPESQER